MATDSIEFLKSLMVENHVDITQVKKFLEDFIDSPHHNIIRGIQKYFANVELTKLSNPQIEEKEFRYTQGRLSVRKSDPLLDLVQLVDNLIKEGKE